MHSPHWDSAIWHFSFRFAEQFVTFGNCTSADFQDGFCIYLKQCDGLYALLMKTPLTTRDRAFLRRSQCGYISGEPLVCCPQKSAAPSSREGRQLGERQSKITALLPQPGECGTTASIDRLSYILLVVGGTNTRINEAPWMALLEYINRKSLTVHTVNGI